MASISFPLDHSRRYGVIESTPGYSVAALLRISEGVKQFFDSSSCIKFDLASPCALLTPPVPKSAPRYITPMLQKVIENAEAAKSSPAARAVHESDGASSPEEVAEQIKAGKASRCVIITEPPGAEIYIDGLKMGKSPNVFALVRHGDTPRRVEIRMSGYRVIEKRVVPDGNTVILEVSLEKQ